MSHRFSWGDDREEKGVEGSQWLSHTSPRIMGPGRLICSQLCPSSPPYIEKETSLAERSPEQSCGLFSTGELGFSMLAL